MSIVQIAPIKINPWTWIARQIGKAINGDLIHEIHALETDVKNIKQDMSDVREEAKEREATARRARILHFGDKILHDSKVSKEYWNSILMDISFYMRYCSEHPYYMNNVAEETIKHIEATYQKCLNENNFL